MKQRLKTGVRILAALLPAAGLTGCMNHMENGQYVSTGSIMAGAFANLLIGMGSVFAVLIFLTWIISLFKHIPKLEQAVRQKERSRKMTRTPEPAPRAVPERRPLPPAPVITSITPKPSGYELQAVIAAAIAAYEADTQPAGTAGSAQKAPKQPPLNNGIVIRTYKRG